MNLQEIFDKNGTDKSSKHKYHLIYEPLFKSKRNEKINFLEVGIWMGLGMQSFVDYFPNGQIYGVDIFSRMTPTQVPILSHERTHWANANSTSFNQMLNAMESFNEVEFDFILDDGQHTPEANKFTFRNAHKFLKKDGLYIIEDVWPLDKMGPKEYQHPWVIKHSDKYNAIEYSSFKNEITTSGFTIEEFDNRKISGQPDSYVLVLRKE